MLAFIASSGYIIGAVLFVALFIYLYAKMSSYRCASCHNKMIYKGVTKIFEGAKDIAEDITYPPIWVHKYQCNSCGSLYLKNFAPNAGRSIVDIYSGEKIKQYIHISDEEVIERFKKRLQTNDYIYRLYNDEDFIACIDNPKNMLDAEANIAIAISKEAFNEILKLSNQYIENNSSKY
ncbi:hypothetical protein IMX26_09770 [Clostridium sp. 'deep sea']|uniref:hypothetical protein n=1 Tax=Clostridium sp. 'deep sea' TaxID=2779445 RepID=UPI00189679D9|nr:hypothetical protein [Clostridium sp. 'deep sea']QOR33789.1 hypothetical protein IMX26_09770 [Clostridium sp. 'deep sea']